MHIYIVDTSICNLYSLKSALNFIGVKFKVTSNKSDLALATHILLPGVGSFDAAMDTYKKFDLPKTLVHLANVKKIPFLGICLGMQLMFTNSEEGKNDGLGILNGSIKKLNSHSTKYKIPNIGFNKISNFKKKGLFSNFNSDPYFYFTHSYALYDKLAEFNYSETMHEKNFISAFQYKNICATQFHPEKSQSNGLKLLYNFFTYLK